jgi:hypothetical protein
MLFKITTISILGALAAQADILTSTQRFFGMGGQVPSYTEDDQDPSSAAGLGQIPYSEADSDLGIQEILQEPPERAPLLFYFSTTVLRTDSAPSASGPTDESSWLSASRMSLSWRPLLTHGWFGDVGVGEDVYRYDRADSAENENFNLRAGVYKNLPDLDDTVFFARFEYQRITFGSLQDGDYNAQRIRTGLQKTLWAIPRHQLSGSLSGAYEWTVRPDAIKRNELGVDLAYRYAIVDNIYTVLSTRVSGYDYDQGDREDLSLGAMLELNWQLSPNVTAMASVSFDKNNSDSTAGLAALNDYESWSAGLGVGLNWSF